MSVTILCLAVGDYHMNKARIPGKISNVAQANHFCSSNNNSKKQQLYLYEYWQPHEIFKLNIYMVSTKEGFLLCFPFNKKKQKTKTFIQNLDKILILKKRLSCQRASKHWTWKQHSSTKNR